MAVYVLLAFDDDQVAKDFVLETYIMGEITVRAVYKKPVQFCKCNRTSGWTRGKRFGWWVCADCGKPGEAWGKGFVWYTALGTNLLPREICGEPPQPAGWDSPDAWTFLIKKLEPKPDQNPQG